MKVNAASDILARTALYTLTYGAGARGKGHVHKEAGGVIEPAAPMGLLEELDAPTMAAVTPGCMLLFKGPRKSNTMADQDPAQPLPRQRWREVKEALAYGHPPVRVRID